MDNARSTQADLSLYEYGDHQHQQEYPKDNSQQDHEKFHEGKDAHAHNNLDSSNRFTKHGNKYQFADSGLEDQRSIKTTLAAEVHVH